MKIFILPIESKFRPMTQLFKYPAHDKGWGVEQDFLRYLMETPELVTDSPNQADWHYLPVYWTRWHVSHKYGKYGRKELQAEVNRAIVKDSITFTVCQYADGPLVFTGDTRLFLSSRQGTEGKDIPVLCSPHRKPWLLRPRKKYLASFVGRLGTHPLRHEMAERFMGREDVKIIEGNKGARFFVRLMLSSYAALCPRGYGGSSFRLFEAMQLGVVPLLIGELDTRPFKNYIPWGEASLYAESVDEAPDLLESIEPAELIEMGKRAEMLWKRDITFGKWCRFLIRDLKEAQ